MNILRRSKGSKTSKKENLSDDNRVARLLRNTVRAHSAMQRRDWKLAAQLWNDVLQKADRDTPVEIYTKLSECYRHLKQFVEADNLLEKPLQKFPNSKPLVYEYAEIASSRNDWQEAYKRWLAILSSGEENISAHAYARVIEACAKDGGYTEAEQFAERAHKLFPNSLPIEVSLARTAKEKNDKKLAGSRWSMITNKFSKEVSPAIIAEASVSIRKSGMVDEAERIIDMALVRYGSNVALLKEKAEIFVEHEDWDKATDQWQFIIDEFDDSLTASDRLLCRFNLSVLSRLVNIKEYGQEIANYKTRHQKSSASHKNKAVVYTAMSKGYDTLKLPTIIDKDFDYVCFTDDDKLDGFGIFDIRPLPYPDSDPGRAIRYAKMHPHVLFKDYETVIWLDASIMINGDLRPLISKFKNSGRPLGTTPHPERASIEEEYQACVNLLKDDPKIMKKQLDQYRKEGIQITDFAENGVLFFDVKSRILAQMLELWWEQILKFSKRDQLSFGYAVKKTGLSWFPLSTKPNDIRNHPDLILSPHQDENNVITKLYKRLSVDV